MKRLILLIVILLLTVVCEEIEQQPIPDIVPIDSTQVPDIDTTDFILPDIIIVPIDTAVIVKDTTIYIIVEDTTAIETIPDTITIIDTPIEVELPEDKVKTNRQMILGKGSTNAMIVR